MATTAEHLLTQRELCDLLQVVPRTLVNWRNAGSGPSYCRLGRGGRAVRYKQTDVDAWLESRRVDTGNS